VIALLHLIGWGVFLSYGHSLGPAYAGAGALAYSFGLRHAFDADHVSAVDDTTRLLMQRGERPLGVGFFFSLGHSSVVVGLAIGLAVATATVKQAIPTLQRVGGTIGTAVSGTFLLGIAAIDLMILVGMLDLWRQTKRGTYDPEHLDELMTQRGFMNRLLGSRWRTLLSRSWQMFPVGFLFGLGFDTASEIGLLALTTAAATTSGHRAPWPAVLALPVLFAAGMTLMDTTDGVFMVKAYGWAFTNPVRKVYYSLSTVALGVFVAAGIGLVEYLQVIGEHAGLHGPFWAWISGLDFELLGYLIVGAFLVFWLVSIALYKLRRIDERYSVAPTRRPDRGVADTTIP
jgi:high-affinity nickel-transport protein